MIQSGSVRQSDLHLLTIEQAANDELRIAALQSYHTHLMDLNILCGIKDTAKVDLEHIDLQPDLSSDMLSSFWERYRLDSLNTVASLNTFHSQYKPQLNLFNILLDFIRWETKTLERTANPGTTEYY